VMIAPSLGACVGALGNEKGSLLFNPSADEARTAIEWAFRKASEDEATLFLAFIGHTATLEQYPRLRASRLWAMVRDRGYPGSAIQVQRYVRTVRPAARAEAYLRLDTLCGEQAQVDWGNFGQIRVGSTTRLLSCFVLVLSWSRACY